MRPHVECHSHIHIQNEISKGSFREDTDWKHLHSTTHRSGTAYCGDACGALSRVRCRQLYFQSPHALNKHNTKTSMTHHLLFAPSREMTSFALSFWFAHRYFPSSTKFPFIQLTVLRSLVTKLALVSCSAGAVVFKRWRKRAHQFSMAFKSGECLGCVAIKSKPALWIAPWQAGDHKHRS